MLVENDTRHWLAQYASDCYRWQRADRDGTTSYYRPQGLVEVCFDADGRYYEGRADISMRMHLRLQTTLSQEEQKNHITLAWACIRNKHLIAQVKAPSWQPWMNKPDEISQDHCFLIDLPRDSFEAIQQASKHIDFLADHYDDIDPTTFFTQQQNAARLLNPDQALSRLLVLPLRKRDDGSYDVTCIFIAAHQIGDGLSVGRWAPDFTRFLNMKTCTLQEELSKSMKDMAARLPPAQEALYPPIVGSRAKKRWFWLLTRILRHVRKPLPAGFENPLLRSGHHAEHISPLWSPPLQYHSRPPTYSTPCEARLSKQATARMLRICRAAKVSVGAGCFALAAILMMEFYELRQPSVPLELRKPFITGFPLNPRPFLVGSPAANSLMLAFSDGILLPFLPSSLDFEGRLRLLAKTAQRQLAVYQKRSNLSIDKEGLQYMSSRGAGRMLAIQYISSFERAEMLLPASKRQGHNPQGAYAMRPNVTRQTCGVSSTGRRQPLNDEVEYHNLSFKAIADDMQPCVRARDEEFLIGIAGTETGIVALVSLDGGSMDPGLVKAWLYRFEHILEEEAVARL